MKLIHDIVTCLVRKKPVRLLRTADETIKRLVAFTRVYRVTSKLAYHPREHCCVYSRPQKRLREMLANARELLNTAPVGHARLGTWYSFILRSVQSSKKKGLRRTQVRGGVDPLALRPSTLVVA